MPAIILSDNGVSSGSAGLKTSGSNDGILALQTTTAGGTATTAVTINTSQNVGLGVTPSAWTTNYKAIQVGAAGAFWASATSGTTILSSNAYYDGTNYNYLLGTSNAATAYFQTSGQHRWLNAPNGTGVITFTQAMTLDASGNLGVGTTSPGQRLHAFAGSGANTVAKFESGSGSTIAYLQLTANGQSDTNSGYIGYSSSNVMSFFTLNTERARIDSAGNLGLGVTPSAWASDKKVIQLTNGSSFYSNTSVPATYIGANFFENSGGSPIYSTTAAATQYYQFAGSHVWRNAPSGTAGNAITFTQAMTLDTSGNFLIGTTTNIGSARTSIVNASGVTLNLEKATGSSIQFTYSGGTTDAQIAGGGSGSLLFYTGNTLSEKARFDASGNFLFSCTSIPGAGGSNGIALRPNGTETANTPRFDIVGSASTVNNTVMQVYSNGASNYRFYVQWNGQIYATQTSITGISDRSLKTNIRDLDTGLAQVMALKPRRFDWINGDAADVAGFVAQEVEDVLPDLVYDYKYSKDSSNSDVMKKGLKMGDMLPTLVKAIQEQQAIIAQLQADVATLKGTP